MQTSPEIKELIKKYFTFSSREYKSAIAMLIFTLLIWKFSAIKNHFFPEKVDSTLLYQKAAALDALMSENNPYKEAQVDLNSLNNDSSSDNLPKAPFLFNPNTATNEDFKNLGFSDKQIHIIRNFIEKVGKIKSKQTFKKIYGINKQQFEALEPYIDLPESTNQINHLKTNNNYSLSVELNTADSLALDKLPGIGMGYARRIIKYRSALGGFVNSNQLLEVYGFRTTLLDSIKPYITINTTLVQKININTVPIDTLKKHPYIRYKIASALCNYRLQHGPFKTLEDIKQVVLIDDSLYDKIKYYLTVD